MYDNFEVITTYDKAKRDEMFEDLKRNGNALERQVVKFSGNELIADGDGLIELRTVRYELTGHIGKLQTRLMYRSTWSVAYPRTDEKGKVPEEEAFHRAAVEAWVADEAREIVEA